MNKPLTLLIHGLHMHGIYMAPLARNLTKEGFSCQTFSYNSLTKSIDVHSKDLHAWLTHHHDGSPINLVGHSLGGLIIRHFVATYGHHWHVHRCVSLGTPHQGSICASYAHRLCPPLIGQSYLHALDGNCVALPSNIVFGVIAGTRPLGLGLPVLGYHSKKHRLSSEARQNDGTVYLSETYLPTFSDYLVLPVNHTGFLTNKTVAKEIVHFLEHGRFSQSSPPPHHEP